MGRVIECLSRWPTRGPLYASSDVSHLVGKALMRQVTAKVAAMHGYDSEQLTGPSRRKGVSAARMDAMARIYATGRFSTPQVGSFFNRDHTTVLYALKRASGVPAREASKKSARTAALEAA